MINYRSTAHVSQVWGNFISHLSFIRRNEVISILGHDLLFLRPAQVSVRIDCYYHCSLVNLHLLCCCSCRSKRQWLVLRFISKLMLCSGVLSITLFKSYVQGSKPSPGCTVTWDFFPWDAKGNTHPCLFICSSEIFTSWSLLLVICMVVALRAPVQSPQQVTNNYQQVSTEWKDSSHCKDPTEQWSHLQSCCSS